MGNVFLDFNREGGRVLLKYCFGKVIGAKRSKVEEKQREKIFIAHKGRKLIVLRPALRVCR